MKLESLKKSIPCHTLYHTHIILYYQDYRNRRKMRYVGYLIFHMTTILKSNILSTNHAYYRDYLFVSFWYWDSFEKYLHKKYCPELSLEKY